MEIRPKPGFPWVVGELTLFVRGHEVLNIKPLALSWEPLEKCHGPGFQGRKKATGPELWRRLREDHQVRGHGHNKPSRRVRLTLTDRKGKFKGAKAGPAAPPKGQAGGKRGRTRSEVRGQKT